MKRQQHESPQKEIQLMSGRRQKPNEVEILLQRQQQDPNLLLVVKRQHVRLGSENGLKEEQVEHCQTLECVFF